MKKIKVKKLILSILGIILVVGLAYGITFYFSFFQGWSNVENGQVLGNSIKEDKLSKYPEHSIGYKVSTNPNDNKISQIKDINLSLVGNKLPKNYEILEKDYRYYIPLNFVSKTLGYSLEKDNGILLKKGNIKIELSSSDAKVNNKPYKLRGELLDYNKQKYLSISDIEYLFSLTSVFNSKDKTIDLLKSNINRNTTTTNTLKNGRVALIRLEDFTAGGSLLTDQNQAKVKSMFDYLYSNNIRFNIAWVPHYKNPHDNYDNNLLTNKDLNNISFVNLLDYAINSNGEVGLHGYTHQAGDSISTVGSELTGKINNTDEETRQVVENALNTASQLNIPVTFFESPHYHATKEQKKIIGEYFQVLYEPYSVLYYTGLKTTDDGNLYIPTPLGYVKDRDPESIIKRLDDPSPYLLASMFYHPTLELEYIDLDYKDNTFNYKQKDDSILKKLITALNEKGYSTVTASEMTK